MILAAGLKLGLIGAAVLGICLTLAAFPDQIASMGNSLGAVTGTLQQNFARICFVVCLLGQAWSFYMKNQLRFLLFSGSLLVTWVLGW